MPVVLVPIHFNRFYTLPQVFPSTKRSIVLRPFLTRDFMTGEPAIPGKDIPFEVDFIFLNFLFYTELAIICTR